MTGPLPEDDVEIPLRLQAVVARPNGWRGRLNGLIAAGLVGFVVLGIVLGTAFDDGAPTSSPGIAAAPASSSPSPSRRPNPTREPLATPLPTREIMGGEIPTERRLVYANGLQLLDLGTGRLTSIARSFDDLLLPLSDDQLVCACVVRGSAVSGNPTVPSPTLRFGRFELSGEPIVERDLLTLDGLVPVPEMTEGFNVAAALDADQRTLFVLAVVRRPPVWTVELLTVDVETGELSGTTVLDDLPVDLEEPRPSASARPGGGAPDGVYAWANSITVAPDGRHVHAAISYSEVRSENWTNRNREWMVPIHDGTPTDPTPLSPAAVLTPDAWCISRPTFLDPDLLVQVCMAVAPQTPDGVYSVRRVTTAGDSLGDLPVPGAQPGGSYPAAAIVDRVRRTIVVWDAGRHTIARIGIDDGGVEQGRVPDSMLPGDRGPGIRGYRGAEPGMVASPDGLRLYALGIGPGSGQVGTSTGVWVFDAPTLRLIDHWEPRALLTSLAVSADGRFVYAAGAAGYDVDGRDNPWPASVTVYDALSGEIQVLYGAIARDTWVSFPSWP